MSRRLSGFMQPLEIPAWSTRSFAAQEKLAYCETAEEQKSRFFVIEQELRRNHCNHRPGSRSGSLEAPHGPYKTDEPKNHVRLSINQAAKTSHNARRNQKQKNKSHASPNT